MANEDFRLKGGRGGLVILDHFFIFFLIILMQKLPPRGEGGVHLSPPPYLRPCCHHCHKFFGCRGNLKAHNSMVHEGIKEHVSNHLEVRLSSLSQILRAQRLFEAIYLHCP